MATWTEIFQPSTLPYFQSHSLDSLQKTNFHTEACQVHKYIVLFISVVCNLTSQSVNQT